MGAPGARFGPLRRLGGRVSEPSSVPIRDGDPRAPPRPLQGPPPGHRPGRWRRPRRRRSGCRRRGREGLVGGPRRPRGRCPASARPRHPSPPAVAAGAAPAPRGRRRPHPQEDPVVGHHRLRHPVGWAFLFAFTLEPPRDREPRHRRGRRALLVAGCSACHGADGGGGVGPAFADGAVIETFATYEDHVEWVTLGSQDWLEATGRPPTATPPSRWAAAATSCRASAEHGGAHRGGDPPGRPLRARGHRRATAASPTLAEATGEECAPGTEAEAATE